MFVNSQYPRVESHSSAAKLYCIVALVTLAGCVSFALGSSNVSQQMYTSTATRPSITSTYLPSNRGAARSPTAHVSASPQNQEAIFSELAEPAYGSNATVSKSLTFLGISSIVAGAVLLINQLTRSQEEVAMLGSISRKKVPLALEEGALPMNTFGPKKPFVGKIKSVERIVGPKATGETCNVVIETDGNIPYWEGQSYGVIPPGTKINSKGKEVPHGTRLYSIASSRYGDNFDGKTTTLCVRRATYWDPEMGKEDPAKKGICSNFLCDAKPGTEVMMTGPTGKLLLLDADPTAAHICVATGTGIAPFRSFWRRMFYEDVPGYKFNGMLWLFMGVANSDALLYDNEIKDMAATYPKNFRVDYALSREQTNTKGGKMYIQDKVEEYADQVFDLLSNGAHIYFCGLKGMMPGIQDMLERVSTQKGLKWEEYFAELKKNGQWHVEVY